MLSWIDWIELTWILLNEFETFNEFEMLNTPLKTVMITCENSVNKKIYKYIRQKQEITI